MVLDRIYRVKYATVSYMHSKNFIKIFPYIKLFNNNKQN